MTRTLIVLQFVHILYMSSTHGSVDNAHLIVLGLLVGWDVVIRLAAAIASSEFGKRTLS